MQICQTDLHTYSAVEIFDGEECDCIKISKYEDRVGGTRVYLGHVRVKLSHKIRAIMALKVDAWGEDAIRVLIRSDVGTVEPSTAFIPISNKDWRFAPTPVEGKDWRFEITNEENKPTYLMGKEEPQETEFMRELRALPV
jgi:hypothetical protein